MRTLIAATIVLTGAVLTTAGCSNPATDPAGSSGEPVARVVIDVTIKDGQVTPTNQQVQAAVKQPIVIRVTSDAADQLHVHTGPEHTFAVKPESSQSFQFTVDVPGKVDVELHDLNRIVATITVR